MNWPNRLNSVFSPWYVGYLIGVPIYIHWSWLLILLVFLAISWPVALFLVGVFSIILLHEFGHIFVIQRVGGSVVSIVLYPTGGIARGRFTSSQELWVTLGGPLVNVLLIPFLHFCSVAFESAPSVSRYFGSLEAANFYLLLFNLIPAFPLDGGRLLRAVLAWYMDQIRATKWCVRITYILAPCIALFGIYIGNIVLVPIALLLYYAADQELKNLEKTEVRVDISEAIRILHESQRTVEKLHTQLSEIRQQDH